MQRALRHHGGPVPERRERLVAVDGQRRARPSRGRPERLPGHDRLRRLQRLHQPGAGGGGSSATGGSTGSGGSATGSGGSASGGTTGFGGSVTGSGRQRDRRSGGGSAAAARAAPWRAPAGPRPADRRERAGRSGPAARPARAAPAAAATLMTSGPNAYWMSGQVTKVTSGTASLGRRPEHQVPAVGRVRRRLQRDGLGRAVGPFVGPDRERHEAAVRRAGRAPASSTAGSPSAPATTRRVGTRWTTRRATIRCPSSRSRATSRS